MQYIQSLKTKHLKIKHNYINWLWVFWCATVINIPFKIVGSDQGDSLPWTWTTWVLWSLIIFLLGLHQKKNLEKSSASTYIIIAAILLSLPILWSPILEWRIHCIPRILGLWAGLLLLFSLKKNPLLNEMKYYFIFGLFLTALIQSVIVIFEVFYINELPPYWKMVVTHGGYGTFSQKNVSASMIATGLVCSCTLFINNNNRWIKSILNISIPLIVIAILILNSRSGWIGSSMGCIIFIIASFYFKDHNNSFRLNLLIMLLFLGVVIGLVINHSYLPEGLTAAHTGSNIQRWLTIRETMNLIIHNLLTGTGYGGYEYIFQKHMAAQTINLNRDLMNHPHNEILLWWMEGGLSALLGILILVFVFVKDIMSIRNLEQVTYLALMIPISVHAQLEYPFYLSTFHWIAFIVFYSLFYYSVHCVEGKTVDIKKYNLQAIFIAAIALICFFSSVVAFRNEVIMYDFESGENTNLENIDFPWMNYERYQWCLALNHILKFNQSHSKQELLQLKKILQSRLRVHVDKKTWILYLRVEKELDSSELNNDLSTFKKEFPYEMQI
ncbi:O-antigen ligase family protein [Buttiauxella agrestis]|uniref:O-antigen ligase family protein n=1 Tax=Buttiauxella agrestis TaxID=82977 RepID=UPI003976588D